MEADSDPTAAPTRARVHSAQAAGAQGAAGATGGSTGGAKKDDVIDAEYEVNDEKKG